MEKWERAKEAKGDEEEEGVVVVLKKRHPPKQSEEGRQEGDEEASLSHFLSFFSFWGLRAYEVIEK